MNNVQVGQPGPDGVLFGTRKAALNNNLAQAYAQGDPRAAMKPYDRAGMSRGAGQMAQGGIDATQKMSQGIADAYTQDAQVGAYNAANAFANQQGQQQFALQQAALQQQDAYAQAMAQLQRKQQSMNFVSSLLGGLLR